MQVHVITLSGKVPLQISKVFPETEPFAAVDTRSIDIQVMLRNGMITQGAAETLEHGRKYHHELSGKGGVGLYQTMRTALESGTGPLLLMEDDCRPSEELPAICKQLVEASDEFDLAVFGPLRYTDGSPSSVHSKFERLNGYFWGLHGVLYTAEGRKRAAAALQGPVNIQIDGKLSRLNKFNPSSDPLRILIQTKGVPLATQQWHKSGVQSGGCLVCEMPPSKGMHPLVFFPIVNIIPVFSIALAAGVGAVIGRFIPR